MNIDIINNNLRKYNNFSRTQSSSKTRLNSIRLDKNERVNKHKKIFLQNLKKEISSDLVSAYPEFHKIYKLLAKKLKLGVKNIVLTAGADLVIKNTFELFYKKNKNVITICPTFAMVDVYCKIFKTKQIKIKYNQNLALDTSALIKSIDKNTCLVILANPNSPTGTLIKNNIIDKILKKAKKFNAKVLIDEAYYEFSDYTCINKIKNNRNLIIARTFSKIYGLAGLRCGYVVSNSKNIKKYFAIKPMYEVNSIAVRALELILQNFKMIKDYLREMREGEIYAMNFCKKNNFKFIKCYTNFFHVDFNYNPKTIQNYLLKKNILVRGGPGTDTYKNYLRISFASKKTISFVLNKVKKFLSLKK
jgi:histidinol-phosphate aminotransferase